MVESIEEYQVQLDSLGKQLRAAISARERLEDVIVKYLNEADKTGTMNPKNLRILREAVTK